MKVSVKLIMMLSVIVFSAGCGSEQWRSYHGFSCGTACNITYRSATDLTDSIVELLSLIESNLTVFDPQSQVSALNRGDDIIAGQILRQTFETSKKIAKMTGGACDPTVGSLVELWGFGHSEKRRQPTDAEINSAMASVGIDACAVTTDGRISKKSLSTTFNFGAIGKGLAAQAVADMFRRNGITDCMVEVGGDLALSGLNPRGTVWILQVDAPVGDTDAPAHEQLMRIGLTDCGIATSGNYRNYRDDNEGHRYGHTISPRTGYPVTTDVLSATVIAPDAAVADGVATACMVLGSDRALDMASDLPGIEIMLVTASDDTSASDSPWQILSTSGFPSTCK